MGARVELKADKPKRYSESPTTLGEHLLRERTLRRLHQDEAGKLVGVGEATYLNWDKDKRETAPQHWPALIRFLRTDPHPEPPTLGEQMAAK